jgi:hypothetical protein
MTLIDHSHNATHALSAAIARFLLINFPFCGQPVIELIQKGKDNFFQKKPTDVSIFSKSISGKAL